MKKSLMILPVILIIIPIAFAESKIFSDNVITDSYLKLADGTFRFTFDSSGNQTFVMTPTINMIIPTSQCKSNGVFKVCINSADYYDRNITTYMTYYKINVNIYKETGSLAANGTAGSTALLQKESTSVKITINNPTDLDVTKISYVEDFYPFTPINVTGCKLDGTVIKWSGSLQSRYTQTCTATLFAPEKSGVYNLAGNLSYFNGFNSETSSTGTLPITVAPNQLLVVESSDKNSEMNKPFYINLSLSNINSNEDLDVSMSIPISNNFIIIKKTAELVKDTNSLAYSARMRPGNSINFSMYFKATAGGNYSISKRFTYTIKNMKYTIENSTQVSVLDPAPLISLISEYSEISPGQNFIVSAKLTNPSAVYSIKDIQAKLSIPYFDDVKRALKQLEPNESYMIISNTFELPESAYQRDYLRINLGVDYNLNDIARSVNKSVEIKIKQKSGANNSVSSANNPSNNNSVSSANFTSTSPNPVQQNQNASPPVQQSQPPQPKNEQPQVTEEKFSFPKPKLDFSDKRVLVFIGVLFALLFIIPTIIFKLKKNKKEKTLPPFSPPFIPPETPR